MKGVRDPSMLWSSGCMFRVMVGNVNGMVCEEIGMKVSRKPRVCGGGLGNGRPCWNSF